MKPSSAQRTHQRISFLRWPSHLRDHLNKAFDDSTLRDAKGEFLDELAEDTRENYIAALSVFLMFLSQRGVDLAQGWEMLLQHDMMWEFYLQQKAKSEASSRSKTGKPRTHQDYLDRIVAARLRLVPGQRDILFEEHRRRERLRSKCKQAKLLAPVDAQTLFDISMSRMNEYKTAIENGTASKRIYCWYQTALQIGFLSQVPVRRLTLLLMHLSDMQEADGCFVFHLTVPKNRGKEVITRQTTPELTPYWQFFLGKARPFFKPAPTGALWSEKDGRPLGEENFGGRFKRFIKREANVHMSPHLVRHAGASLAEAMELDPQIVAAVIQDRATSTPALHYASHEHGFAPASLARLSQFTKGGP